MAHVVQQPQNQVVQQPQHQKNSSTLTITPVTLIEQTTAGFTSQVFTNDPLTVTPDGLHTQHDANECLPAMNNEVERRFAEKPVKNEAVSQTWFENAVKRELNIPNGYEKVAVLVVRWDDDLDDPKFKEGHDEEVKRLKRVFGERFHFDVSSEIRLSTAKKPQTTLNKAIIDHMDAFDGPNNLLIIYYTGHGSLLRVADGEQQLQLAATTNSHRISKGSWPATAIWCQAEKPLMESAEADVLSLLDCCYAGNAHKGVSGERRTYELLAACPRGQKTRGPGPNSFTTRLLDALEHLLDTPKDPPIIMTRLEEVINTRAPQGLLTQVMLLDRLDNHIGRHIQLAPVQERAKKENEKFQSRPQEKSVVKLLFSLEVEKLSQSQIESWAHELSKLRNLPAKIPIRRIDWMKVESRSMTQRWKDALNFVQMQNKKRKSVPGGSSGDDISPLAKRRTREDLALPDNTHEQWPLTPADST